MADLFSQAKKADANRLAAIRACLVQGIRASIAESGELALKRALAYCQDGHITDATVVLEESRAKDIYVW